ncbi:uncharacterized protein LOC144090536 isoform X2 [Stigmatopora argus]
MIQLSASVVLFVLSYAVYRIGVGLCAAFILTAIVTSENTPLNLACMAAECYVAVCLPLSHARLCTVRRTLLLVGAIWGASLLSTFPDLLFTLATQPAQFFSGRIFCLRETAFPSPVLARKRDVTYATYLVLVWSVLFFLYFRILFTARSANKETKKAEKARRTIVLHGVQVLLCMTMYAVPLVKGALLLAFPKNYSDSLFACYVVVQILPRAISPIIYGDQIKKMIAIDTKMEDSPSVEDPKGIPDFWLTIFRNADMLTDMIQEHDEPILKHLKDVQVKFSEAGKPMSFTLEFYFEPNCYFNNAVLTKVYKMKFEPDTSEPFSFEGPEIVDCVGCMIDWHKGKDVTVKTIKKKQKHKGRGTVRTVTKQVPNPSFFNFFNPVKASPDGDEPDDDSELTFDFEIGHFFRERIIPRAVLYFTGEAMEDDESFDEELEEGDEEQDDDDEEEEEDDDDDDDDGDFQPRASLLSTFPDLLFTLATEPARFFSGKIFCLRTTAFPSPVLARKRDVTYATYLVLVWSVLFFLYFRILFTARSANKETKKAEKARRTIVLHGVQVLLCMTMYAAPVVRDALQRWFPENSSDSLFANYVVVQILPRAISPIIYGVRDKCFRKHLKNELICGRNPQ